MVTGDIDQKGGSSIFKVLYGDQAKLFEKEQVPKLKHNKKFTVSMVNDGKIHVNVTKFRSAWVFNAVESYSGYPGVYTWKWSPGNRNEILVSQKINYTVIIISYYLENLPLGNGYHGSQFLITTTENADALDGLHTVFGIVTEGKFVVVYIVVHSCV